MNPFYPLYPYLQGLNLVEPHFVLCVLFLLGLIHLNPFYSLCLYLLGLNTIEPHSSMSLYSRVEFPFFKPYSGAVHWVCPFHLPLQAALRPSLPFTVCMADASPFSVSVTRETKTYQERGSPWTRQCHTRYFVAEPVSFTSCKHGIYWSAGN